MILCVGPKGSGKTLLLKRLQNVESVDYTSSSVSTIGTNIFTIKLKTNNAHKPIKELSIREVGGTMAPMWKNYFQGTKKILYIVDTSNLCQITAAGVLLYTILSDPKLETCKICLVLTKMDAAYRQMRNEALLILQLNRLKTETRQKLTVIEVSAMTGKGIEEVQEWLLGQKKNDGVKTKGIL